MPTALAAVRDPRNSVHAVHRATRGVDAQNCDIFTLAAGVDWTGVGLGELDRGLCAFRRRRPGDFRPGQHRRLRLESWITQCDDAGSGTPLCTVGSVRSENKVFGLSGLRLIETMSGAGRATACYGSADIGAQSRRGAARRTGSGVKFASGLSPIQKVRLYRLAPGK